MDYWLENVTANKPHFQENVCRKLCSRRNSISCDFLNPEISQTHKHWSSRKQSSKKIAVVDIEKIFYETQNI